MSNTIVYGLKINEISKKLVSFKNSHGYGMALWNIYADNFLGVSRDNINWEEFWGLIENPKVSFQNKITLFSTYDRTIIKKENFKHFLNCLITTQKEIGVELDKKNYINHVASLINYMKNNMDLLNKYDYIGIQTTDLSECQYYIDWETNDQIHPDFGWDESLDENDPKNEELWEEYYGSLKCNDREAYYNNLTKINDMQEIFDYYKNNT